ncbi:sugar transferase [Alkalicoccobacillus porphyridii]|uniref:Sugar transferase n=1 Tax=Alkalicoccobacillus porphyridii TaxID=2597270 RepID=A0A554A466_9BACI|nr:sugar transferase [Alkalicoccobacillus porphyridii]TSB48484.1 sugar transferase [Alkalicoccobacillus porphyridii]
MNISKESHAASQGRQARSEIDYRFYDLVKRTIDVCGAIFGIIMTLPLCLLISLSYLFEEKKGPIFFKQLRVGKNGKLFYIYKFRSMALNAEERLHSDRELYKKYVDNNYKLEPHEDPRVTTMGAFLRKTSLDELPQLINVLKGEMSLVGPRPVVKEELAEYQDHVTTFLSVKPGVTGFWQVSGRSQVVYPERVDVELYYVDNRSMVLDLQIIFRTVWKVFIRSGAY